MVIGYKRSDQASITHTQKPEVSTQPTTCFIARSLRDSHFIHRHHIHSKQSTDRILSELTINQDKEAKLIIIPLIIDYIKGTY